MEDKVQEHNAITVHHYIILTLLQQPGTTKNSLIKIYFYITELQLLNL
jgi:hypothetical protein